MNGKLIFTALAVAMLAAPAAAYAAMDIPDVEIVSPAADDACDVLGAVGVDSPSIALSSCAVEFALVDRIDCEPLAAEPSLDLPALLLNMPDPTACTLSPIDSTAPA